MRSNTRVGGRVRALPLTAACLLLAAQSAQAASFDPIIELFRLGAGDHLIIDRGGPVGAAGDVNGDGNPDLLVGAGTGGVRVVYGPTNGNNGVLNAEQLQGVSGFVINNDAQNSSVLAGAGDFNADGIDDVVVGSSTGTRIVFGRTEGFRGVLNVSSLNGQNGLVFDSPATDVKAAGDVNGDGIADIIVGNAHASPNSMNGAGVSYVLYGSGDAFPASLAPADLDGNNGFAIVGINAEDRTGYFVSGAGDFNNDGVDDFLIGAPYKTVGNRAEAGEAYLVYGTATGFPAVISLFDLDGGNGFTFKGSDIQDVAGASVGGIGDLNHDGIDDIAIGAPSKGPFGVPSDYPGETYVLFGGRFDAVDIVREDDLNGSNGFVLRGIRGGVVPIEQGETIWGDMAGADVSPAGDINGDGVDDLLVGAPHTVRTSARKGVGQAYFIYGSTSAFPQRLSLADLDGANGFQIQGIGTVDYFAVSVSNAGDFNRDGHDDVIMGASGQGESYVFYGRDTGVGRQPRAPQGPTGTASTGFQAAALTLGAQAEPLAFPELADPTGDTPLPPGTPTDPLDPQTPGYEAPKPQPNDPPLRPGNAPAGGTTSGSTTDAGTTTSGQGTGGANGNSTTGTGTAGGDSGEPMPGSGGQGGATEGGDAGEPEGNGAIVTGRGGGGVLYLPAVLLAVLWLRRRHECAWT